MANIPYPVKNVDFHIGIDTGIGGNCHTEVELDVVTGMLFNRREWQKAKLLELGLNKNGDPLRPHEKERPRSETTLDTFTEETE